MKRLFSLFSMLIMLSSNVLPAFTYAKEIDDNTIINLFSSLLSTYGGETSCEVGTEYISGDYKGVTTENCGIKITQYTGVSTAIEIPEKINGFIVKEIGENVFKDKGITSVSFPNTIEIIGTGAFQNNNFNENSINLPKSLKNIKNYAFKSSKIKYIQFNEGLENIGEYAFSYNNANEWTDFEGNIYIPDTVKTIGQGAFMCTPIKKLHLGKKVEKIGNWAFQNCSSYSHHSDIEEVIIPGSVKEIGENGFQCTKINKLEFEEGIEKIGNYAFQQCSTSSYGPISTYKKIIIPESVKLIGNGAFSSNRLLNEVTIGNGAGIIEIRQYSFSSCGITGFYINKDTIDFGTYGSIGGNPYEEIIISGNNINTNNNGYELRWENYNNSYAKPSLTLNLSGSINQIRWDNNMIKQLNIGTRINEIGTIIFKNFGGDIITIPGNVKKIIGNNDVNMFEKELTLEEGIEEIGDTAFRYNYNINSVTIPSTIKKIGQNAFYNNNKTKALTLKEGIEEIGTGAFSYNDIQEIFIPDSVKKIGNNAFCRTQTGDGHGGWISQITNVHVMNDIIPENYNTNCLNYIRHYKIDFTGDSNLITIPERQILDLSGNVTEPIIPEIEGYEFKGWHKLGESENYNFSTEVNENIILEASLSKNSYKVTYNNAEGVGDTTVLFNEDIPLPTPKNRTGYNFNGWGGLPENGKMPARDIILTGQWSIISPSAGGGQSITSTKQETKVTGQEHNSADTEDQKTTNTQTNTSTNNITTSEEIKQQVKKVEDRSLTRGEIAIMTNILLKVYPQLVEGKQELDDVTNACLNYADEQNFTKDEKKAITRLCKLSIMGIHNDTNEPLEEFLVNNKSTNDEFSKVINRSIETYNEKDLTTIKDALKKLEGDEENVVFGTVYDVFMSIKNIFN